MFARAPARFVLQSVCACLRTQSFSHTACRNTVIVERWWQVPLSKEGSAPRLHPRRHRVYRLVEDTKHNMKDKMELLLTQTVPKLGGRGDTVFVKKSLGRNKLLAEGLAVYPSPENKELFAEERRLLREGKREDRIQTRTGQLTVEFLKKSALEVGIQPAAQQQFHLTKEIVCRHFLRKLGVVVPPHALTLPDEPITQFGDFWCEVTVNGLDTVRVLLSVGPYVDPRKKKLMKLEAEAAAAAATENKPETESE
ncbi:39S ribosomal protein L9, mitochondrial [Pangasianodon hypophthalmus]|uniref:39S ribosomal protein L9, mitochondrial n=1 Tax=Pangasianodon hypophthalmus TaxID=310915 RepID=UPI002307B5E3|nr:39S ribosomal protein L9, mitochondrial [Pangasianodon hypophthalmus]